MKELTILMPCLNEAETLETCIVRAKRLLGEHGIDGEVLISDNGSTDGSQEIARARVRASFTAPCGDTVRRFSTGSSMPRAISFSWETATTATISMRPGL